MKKHRNVFSDFSSAQIFSTLRTGLRSGGWKYPEGLSPPLFAGGSCSGGRSGPGCRHQGPASATVLPVSGRAVAGHQASALRQQLCSLCLAAMLALEVSLSRKLLVSSRLSYIYTHKQTRTPISLTEFCLLTADPVGAALTLRNVAALHQR